MDSNAVRLRKNLKEKGYKLTPQRQAILDVIADNRGTHLNSEQVYELVRASHPGIGMATVYRTLPLLEKMGLLSTIHLDDNCTRYELNQAEGHHSHHHLICIACGTVAEVEDDLLELLEEQVKKQNCFEIKNHSVKFYGYCNKCS